MFDFFSRSFYGVNLFFFFNENCRVNQNSVLRIRMHCPVDQRHSEQNDYAHCKIYRVKNRFTCCSIIGYIENCFACFSTHLERDGAGEPCVPDYKSRISRSDEKRIVHIFYSACDFLCQKSACDKTKAPVEPAAYCGNEGYDNDSAFFVLGSISNSSQASFTYRGRCHSRTQNQYQGHLHSKTEEIPESAVIAPCSQKCDRTLMSSDH